VRLPGPAVAVVLGLLAVGACVHGAVAAAAAAAMRRWRAPVTPKTMRAAIRDERRGEAGHGQLLEAAEYALRVPLYLLPIALQSGPQTLTSHLT
jgi:hypothetical protein